MDWLFNVCFSRLHLKQELQISNGHLTLLEGFYNADEANEMYTQLLESLEWKQGTIHLFGKTHSTPRLEAFYAEKNLEYGYSGQQLKTKNFTPLLLQIKQKLEEVSAYTFNSVLVNYYRDGNDSNGWHADNEKELGENPTIASLSFGTSRRFDLKHISKAEKLSIQLHSGSLLVMSGETQHFWKHQIAKSKKITTGRINLTFRTIRLRM
jgi:alkylated DNA repair dioxygenase AlkB